MYSKAWITLFYFKFRTTEIWDLINDIFSMWENIAIKSQKVKKSKSLICTSSKACLEFKNILDDMSITPWR